jgi:hypothetical protein
MMRKRNNTHGIKNLKVGVTKRMEIIQEFVEILRRVLGFAIL